MLFNSLQFLFFFPVVTLLYFIFPDKLRWLLLLVASCFFYMVLYPYYIFILLFVIAVDYFAGIMIENAAGRARKNYLLLSIAANLGVLFFFKYYGFFIETVHPLLLMMHLQVALPVLRFALPIGLSFHTFQAMSYTIEVYRGNQKAEKHAGIYALYVMFYPQLVAGPIERPQNMLHQFHEKHALVYEDVVAGLRMMMWGLFKKVVIADRLALFTDPVFKNPYGYAPLPLLIAVLFFAFEIYCDFSGYSNIALGAARVMGFKLMTNFNWPYSATSVSEFWRKWHISLSTWFNDYVFTPLALSFRKSGIYAILIASIVTFLLSGLWHGAAWTFIVWGLLHGLALGYEVLTRKWRKKIFKSIPVSIGNFIGLIATFSYVCFTYIFFRAATLADAFYIVHKMPAAFQQLINVVSTRAFSGLRMPLSPGKLLICFLAIAFLQAIYLIQRKSSLSAILNSKPKYVRWAVYYVFVLLIIYTGVFQNRQFIYFQF